jgi:hypothetical protein
VVVVGRRDATATVSLVGEVMKHVVVTAEAGGRWGCHGPPLPGPRLRGGNPSRSACVRQVDPGPRVGGCVPAGFFFS